MTMEKGRSYNIELTSQKRRKMLRDAVEGKGFAKLISEDELKIIFDIASLNDSMVDAIEPFRITENADIAHIELTVNPTWFHEAHSNLNWSEKISAMRKIIDDILSKAHEVGGEFRYNVWTSKRSDWE